MALPYSNAAAFCCLLLICLPPPHPPPHCPQRCKGCKEHPKQSSSVVAQVLCWALPFQRALHFACRSAKDHSDRKRGDPIQREREEDPEASHHLLESPTASFKPPLSADPVSGSSRESRAGRVIRTYSDAGKSSGIQIPRVLDKTMPDQGNSPLPQDSWGKSGKRGETPHVNGMGSLPKPGLGPVCCVLYESSSLLLAVCLGRSTCGFIKSECEGQNKSLQSKEK